MRFRANVALQKVYNWQIYAASFSKKNFLFRFVIVSTIFSIIISRFGLVAVFCLKATNISIKASPTINHIEELGEKKKFLFKLREEVSETHTKKIYPCTKHANIWTKLTKLIITQTLTTATRKKEKHKKCWIQKKRRWIHIEGFLSFVRGYLRFFLLNIHYTKASQNLYIPSIFDLINY